tara:strand:- start:15 stop:581 length:567 start_codon:yes stop_codon:yes gene_type:complete
MADAQLPTPTELRQLLRYEPETGKLFWRRRAPKDVVPSIHKNVASVNRWNSLFADKEALTAIHSDGYRVGHVANFNMSAHRVAFAIFHDAWPEVIDHINGDPGDNRISNLRSVSWAENARNKAINCENTSGYTGVGRCTDNSGKWRATIKVDGKNLEIGRFPTREEAAKAYAAAKSSHGYHKNHGRRK